jgi:hypothetical protein
VIDLLFGVWTVPTLLSATLTGLGFGYVAIGAILRNPRFTSGLATPRQHALVVGGIAMLGGLAFWIGQILSAYADGDDLYWRVGSRFTIWLIFCIALSVGAYRADSRDRDRRAANARAAVRRRIGGAS